jgi:PAS domain S-box-containing protein
MKDETHRPRVHVVADGVAAGAIAAALEAAGFETSAGDDGVAELPPEDWSIVVACCVNCDMGLALTRRLRGQSPHAFVLLVCSQAPTTRELEALLQVGIDDVATANTDDVIRRVTIAHQRASEAKGAALHAHWRALVEGSREIMLTCDRDAVILYINHTVPGLDREQVIGSNALDYVPPEHSEKLRGYIHAAFDERASRIYEVESIGAQGSPATFQSQMAPVIVDDKVVAAAIVTREVTAEREQERQHQALQSQVLAVQKAESLSLLASGIAHDFNNLVGVMMGNASTLLRRAKDAEMRKMLDGIVSAGENAGVLAKQLLAYAGHKPSEISMADLSLQLRAMHKLLATTVPDTIRLELRLSDDVPPADLDVSGLQQVVLNLVINARDAIGDHEGCITVSTGEHDFGREAVDGIVLCSPELRGRCAVLEIHDDGCGIDDATRAKIFEPFFTTKSNGRGLGLAVVSGVMRSHGGAVAVASTGGRGSVFRLYFPASERPASSRRGLARARRMATRQSPTRF